MKRTVQIMIGLLMISTPTLQVFGQETKSEQFKRELLSQIKEEVTDLRDDEIRKIIDQVEASMTEYVEHYEQRDAAEMLNKDQKMLLDAQDNAASTQSFGGLLQRNAEQEAVTQQLAPKLAQFNKRQGGSEEQVVSATASTATLTNKQTLDNEFYRWDLLDTGDVLVNLDNGKLGLKWGHVGMMYDKGPSPEQSRTIEILGFGDVVQFKNYKTTWHDNKTDRISHNYAHRVLGTGKAEKAAEAATKWIGKGYSLWPVLGDTSAFYCTELVFMAYREQGVNLGNGMDLGSWGILMPKSMYCSPELASYYRQNMNGRAGNVC